MSANAESERVERHRWFHAMVMMGSSIALGCGGVTDEDSSSSNDDRTPSGGSGGGGGSGASGGAGGKLPGSGGAGGSIIVGSGGAGGVAGQPDVHPIPCYPAQLDCAATSPYCDGYSDGWSLPQDCACDTTRPRSPDDCAPGQTFVCRRGLSSPDGHPFETPVPFECSCVAEQEYCGLACDAVFEDQLRCADDPASRRVVLCGCAVVVLR